MKVEALFNMDNGGGSLIRIAAFFRVDCERKSWSLGIE